MLSFLLVPIANAEEKIANNECKYKGNFEPLGTQIDIPVKQYRVVIECRLKVVPVYEGEKVWRLSSVSPEWVALFPKDLPKVILE